MKTPLFPVAMAIFAGCLAQAQTRTVLEGVYSDAQASRGEEAYKSSCVNCHRENLQGGAEALSLTGARFLEAWRDDTLDGFYAYMKTRMPRRPVGLPGSLADATYVDIVAYIVKFNEYPASSGELTVGALAGTFLVGKEGRKALGTNAQVQVVGCLMPGPKNTWTLNNASEPARSRNPEETTPEEVSAAASRPPGNQTFRLRNIPDFRPGFTPEPWQEHKVLAKGVLTRQTDNDRIYVLSLETVAPGCNP